MAIKKTEDKAAAKQATADAKEEAKKLAIVKMEPLIKTINSHLEIAAKNDAKADDHRLSASLRLAEAKSLAEAGGVSFKDWCETNLDKTLMITYETARKLAAVGVSGDKDKAAIALADMRKTNALTNKKHRANKKKAAKVAEGKKGTTINDPFKAAAAALDALDDKASLSLTQARAKRLGHVVMAEGEAKQLRALENGSLDGVKKAFGNLKASDKMAFCEWAAKEIGGVFTSEFDAAAPAKAVKEAPALKDGEMPPIPAQLRRRQPKQATA